MSLKDNGWGRVPPDGGWGYGAVIGMTQSMMLFGLAVRSYGVIYLITLERFNTTATVAAWVGATNILVYGLFSPIAALLCNRYSCRLVSGFGTIMLFLGFLLTAFAFHVSIMYISFGLMVGIGVSCTTTACFIIVSLYFEKYRALATSLGSAGASISVFIMPPLTNFLYNYYGYRGCMLILGGISLQGLVSAFLFKPLDKYDKPKTPKTKPTQELPPDTEMQDLSPKQLHSTDINSDSNSTEKINKDFSSDITNHSNTGNITANTLPCKSGSQPDVSDALLGKDGCGGEISQDKIIESAAKDLVEPDSKLDRIREAVWEAVSNRLLVGLVLINVGMTIVATAANTFAPAHAVDNGISQGWAVLLLSWAGLSDTIGRIAIGAVMDKLRVYRMWIYLACTVLGSIAVFMYPIVAHYAWYTVSMVLYEGNIGVCFAQRTTILADVVGLKKMPVMFGFLQATNAIGLTLGRGMGGIVKDQTGTYTYVFYLTGIISLSLCAVMVAILVKHGRSSSGDSDKQDRSKAQQDK